MVGAISNGIGIQSRVRQASITKLVKLRMEIGKLKYFTCNLLYSPASKMAPQPDVHFLLYLNCNLFAHLCITWLFP